MAFMHSRPTRQNQAIPAPSTLVAAIVGTLMLTSIALPLRAEPAGPATLTMTFPGLKGHDGSIMIAIFASEAA